MFPIGDENRGIRHRAYVNWSLIALNILVFLYQLAIGEQDLARFYRDWGALPYQVSGGTHVYTLVTCMFLHGGWLHIAGNMLLLWVFGDNIEDVMGHIQYLLFYLMCGLAAGGLQIFINSGSHSPLIGASGAISGVLAAYLVLFPKGKIWTLLIIGIPLIILLPAWAMIGYWIVLQFINGVASLGVSTQESSGVAYFAHIGGVVAGAVLGFFFRDQETQQQHIDARTGSRTFDRYRMGSRPQ